MLCSEARHRRNANLFLKSAIGNGEGVFVGGVPDNSEAEASNKNEGGQERGVGGAVEDNPGTDGEKELQHSRENPQIFRHEEESAALCRKCLLGVPRKFRLRLILVLSPN